MKIKEAIIAPFREVTGVLKDVGWWLGGAVAVVTIAKPYWDSVALSITLHTAAAIFLLYALVRAIVYRRRNRRIYKATAFVHGLVHDLRNQIGCELTFMRQADKNGQLPAISEDVRRSATIQALSSALQEILDSASRCFQELTGAHCTAVLIMPEQSSEDGRHFKARLYSSNAPGERTKKPKPHKSGLVAQAFKEPQVVCCPDLVEEMKKGNFDKRGEDNPFKWYRAAMLCHFKVCGEPWGILAIDSPEVKIFRPYYNDLICAFADACGLVFIMSELGNFGNHVYRTANA